MGSTDHEGPLYSVFSMLLLLLSSQSKYVPQDRILKHSLGSAPSMRNHISHTTGKHIAVQVFGFIFLYSKSKKNDFGPNGNKRSKAKEIHESYSVGFTALSSVLYDVSKSTEPPPPKKMGSVLFCFYVMAEPEWISECVGE